LDSLSRKPQCPVTCRDGVIRPPRGGAPSCGTKHLRSVRSVSAKQVGYQASSANGSCELAGAPPRCGMVSLTGLSSHRRPCIRCGHIALPRADRRVAQRRCVPGSSAAHQAAPIGLGESTTFTVSVEGIAEMDAAGPHKFCTTIAIARKRITIPTTRLYCTSATNDPTQKTNDPQ
jgi:hypothetical protein